MDVNKERWLKTNTRSSRTTKTKAEANIPGCYSLVAMVKIKAQTVIALP